MDRFYKLFDTISQSQEVVDIGKITYMGVWLYILKLVIYCLLNKYTLLLTQH